MKGIKITTLCIAIASVFGVANAETCVKTTYNVIYGCGDGTEIGTLPADGVADYNYSFRPADLTSACKAPTGYGISGWAIYINNTQVAYIRTASPSFTYRYTADILITPNYVPSLSGVIATPADLVANLRFSSSATKTYTSGASGTWTVNFRWGVVSGVTKCTNIKPENMAEGKYTGWIATDQSAIENAAAGGRYCYCKMTEPYIAASPWVFYRDEGSNSLCVDNCTSYCSNLISGGSSTSWVFRASLFSGAMAE